MIPISQVGTTTWMNKKIDSNICSKQNNDMSKLGLRPKLCRLLAISYYS